MSNNMTEVDAPPGAEQEPAPMTFAEVVGWFCRQQAEFREGLAQGGMNRTETLRLETGGHADGQE